MLIERLFGERRTPIRKIQVPSASPTTEPALRRQEAYFQVGVSQVHIRKLQAFLKDFAPIVYSNLKCQVGSRYVETTFVVDPRQDKSGAAGRLLQGYVPIVAPVPFVNNDIRLTIALLRLEVSDYVPATIDLLTSVASLALPDFAMAGKVSGTLAKGVNALLKDETSFVAGWTGSFSAADPLDPGYTVVTADGNVDASKLMVANDVLMIGDEVESAIPFTESDFILFRINSLESREDFLTLEPITSLYEKAIKAIGDNQVDVLTETHQDLRRAVMSSMQLTLADAKGIIWALTKELEMRWDAQKAEPNLFKVRGERQFKQPVRRVSEAEFETAVAWNPAK